MEAAGLARRGWIGFDACGAAHGTRRLRSKQSPDEQLILAVRRRIFPRWSACSRPAQPNADKVPGFEGRPALFHAAVFGYTDIAQELIDKGRTPTMAPHREPPSL